jgi:hypothetical protein
MEAEERVVAGHWYALGLYAGPSPLELSPVPGIRNPIFTYRDVTDVSAMFVADPFMIRRSALVSVLRGLQREHRQRRNRGRD